MGIPARRCAFVLGWWAMVLIGQECPIYHAETPRRKTQNLSPDKLFPAMRAC
jgi:hypothetical protein